MSKKYIISVFAALISAGLAQGQTLMYEYSFNDAANATYTTSTGSTSATADFTNYVTEGSTDRTSYNLFGSSTSGVSGQAGDYAFDNSISTEMGGSGAINGTGAGYGGLGLASGTATGFNGLTSFTISGWYKANSLPSNYARLIEIGSSSTSTSVLFQGNSGSSATNLRLGTNVGGATANLEVNNAMLLAVDSWVFFAFAVDGVNGTITLYAGTDSAAVTQLGSADITAGTVYVGGDSLAIGNSMGSGNQRPFDGLMDNVRVWGSSTDASGALSLSTLESVRSGDVIPEPSTYAGLFGAAVVCLVLLRRRR
ncbi:MAG: LamG-like jellyroll fold domain-containing protein [Verrucomicrobiota bacterium JB024]|nr:LamG-like jellyroll fold domain-containing protein [Verrucomicrobiota bacterium JB024]